MLYQWKPRWLLFASGFLLIPLGKIHAFTFDCWGTDFFGFCITDILIIFENIPLFITVYLFLYLLLTLLQNNVSNPSMRRLVMRAKKILFWLPIVLILFGFIAFLDLMFGGFS